MTEHSLPLPYCRHPYARRALVVAGALLVSLSSRPASAQAIDDEFTVQRFNPAPGPRNFFTTRGARTDGQMAFSAGLFVNYAYLPFVVKSCESETNCDDPNALREQDLKVVESMVTGDILGSLTPIPRLQLGLRIPVTWVHGQGIDEDGTAADDGLKGVGLGDVELEAKARVVGERQDPFVLGAALFGTGPLGTVTAENKYIGDATPTVGLRGILDFATGPLSAGANIGGVYRGTGTVGSTEIGPEFRYGVAGGFQASPVLRVVLDGFGSTKFSTKNGTNALEIDGGVQVTPLGSPIVLSAGAGTGVIQGVGVPRLRAFLGVLYVGEVSDEDGDGLVGSADQCPTAAEDKDGVEDSDGCPDLDDDGDTIQDDADRCPKEPEDPDGFEDTDGCPEPDNDKDGVPDERDQCADKAETKNGFKDDDGCPDEPDKDGDGVPDSRDQCVDEPEDTDGHADTDGCPDPDNDGDGILDQADECIDQPETKNDFEDQDGCPDEAPKK